MQLNAQNNPRALAFLTKTVPKAGTLSNFYEKEKCKPNFQLPMNLFIRSSNPFYEFLACRNLKYWNLDI